jgi:hypothetical protein
VSKYDEASFWAGVALGQQLKGWSAFGIIDGFDPDGGLIVRPIQQGIPIIKFERDIPFSVFNMTDSVSDITEAPEPIGLQDDVRVIVFQRDTEFAVVQLSDELDAEYIVKYFIIDRNTNQPSYDENFVQSVYNGFKPITSYTEYSVEEEIDSGVMLALRVNTDRFDSITKQEVKLL